MQEADERIGGAAPGVPRLERKDHGITGRHSRPNTEQEGLRIEWSWIRTPTVAPALFGMESGDLRFTVESGGLHLLALDVENECGARSQVPAIAYVYVVE